LSISLLSCSWTLESLNRWDKAIATRGQNSEFAYDLEVMHYFMHYFFNVIAALLFGGRYCIIKQNVENNI
jgi:hypothetical protein